MTVWCLTVGLMVVPPPAFADDQKPVVEQILDILRDRDQISAEQYDELLDHAKKESAAAAPVPTQAEAVVEVEESKSKSKSKSKRDFRVYWKRGVRFVTEDKKFRFRIGGRMQVDAGITDASGVVQEEFDLNGIESGVRFRRAGLYLEGTLYKNFEFKFQYDFAQGVSDFQDVYVAVKRVPWVQRIQVGHFKEPFSLERMTSSNNITFMERSLQSPFDPSRNTGIGMFMKFFKRRMTLAAGAFRITDGLGDGFGSDSPYSLAARVTGLPFYEDKGKFLVHLGLSYAFDFRSGDEIRFRQRPSTGFGPRLVDTEKFVTNDITYIDPEVAVVVGPFSMQAEYLQSFLNQEYLDNPEFFGWYVQASYFLTGEHRPYNKTKGAFARLKPHENFGWGEGSGWGAFQVAARLSQLNLTSGDIQGGRLQDVTLGLNWYLNPVVRVMFNYVYGDRMDSAGSENVYQMRFQTAF